MSSKNNNIHSDHQDTNYKAFPGIMQLHDALLSPITIPVCTCCWIWSRSGDIPPSGANRPSSHSGIYIYIYRKFM